MVNERLLKAAAWHCYIDAGEMHIEYVQGGGRDLCIVPTLHSAPHSLFPCVSANAK